MLIAGAGGHALEVLDILIASELSEDLNVFDQNKDILVFQGSYPLIHTEEELKLAFAKDPRFVLGVGNPKHRHHLYEQMTRLGAELFTLKGQGNSLSGYADCKRADIFNHCFIGPNTRIGKGTLINTGAQIHHEVQIGDFTAINPAAVLLGAVQVGDLCSIGAQATILPGIKIGNRVTIGAGAVVTKDIPDGLTLVGIPARVLGS